MSLHYVRPKRCRPLLWNEGEPLPPGPVLPAQPLHQMTHAPECDGESHRNCKPHEDCVRSYFSTPCPHHPELSKPKVQCCALQRCESSQPSNGVERQRDAWDGTAEKEDLSLGVRSFGEDVDLGIFVLTLPAELRPLCNDFHLSRRKPRRAPCPPSCSEPLEVWDPKRQEMVPAHKHVPPLTTLRDFRFAAGELVLEVLRCLVGNDEAQFFCRSWLHPEGDKEPGEWKPHENVLVPLFWAERLEAFAPNPKVPGAVSGESQLGPPVRGHRIGRCMLPKSWLNGPEGEGWIGKRWRELLVDVFGEWWKDGEPEPVVDWYYHWQTKPKGKGHALKYFSRTFPAWSGVPGASSMRPRAFGLSHWMHASTARSALNGRQPLPWFDECPGGVEEGVECPPRIPVVGRSAGEVLERQSRALDAHSCNGCHAPGFERPLSVELASGAYVQLRRNTPLLTGPPLHATDPPGVVELWVDPQGRIAAAEIPGRSWRSLGHYVPAGGAHA